MQLTQLLRAVVIAVITITAMPAIAEQAPVYDADNLPAQFGGEPDQALPPPPPMESSRVQSFGYAPNPVVSQPSTSLDQRLGRIEQQVSNIQHNDISSQMDSLQKQVQTLRNQVEELTHKLQQAQAQQRTMYTDLDNRLSQRNAAMAAAAARESVANAAKEKEKVKEETASARSEDEALPSAQKLDVIPPKSLTPRSVSVLKTGFGSRLSANSQPNVAEEQAIYQTAYNYIKAKKYNEAVNALQSMLQKYPSGQFAANAHYWLGELYGLMGKNDLAMMEFDTVVKTYQDSPRVSDAQLKLGLIYAAQFKWPDAKTAFKKVVNRYPGTASAHLATEQLKQIKLAGH